jgi:threonyl-tRNA synthetase
VDTSRERMGAKIRPAQLQKMPYMLVVGAQEEAAGTVSVRLRDGSDLGGQPLDELIARMRDEIGRRANG